MNPVPRWRIAAAVLVIVALLGFGVVFAPAYLGNLKLQSYVAEITRRVDSQNASDDALRQDVLKKAQDLGLPVKADNVHIVRTQGEHGQGNLRIDVRYFVRVTLPG